jgi:hypothetical protein
LHHQPNLKQLLRTSIVLLVTSESVCILTAERVDFVFYGYSILLSILLAMLAGSLTIVGPEAYKKIQA